MAEFHPETIRAFVPAPEISQESHVLFDRLFDAGECDRIVELGLGAHGESGEVAAGAAGESEEDIAVRRARIAWIPCDGEAEWISDRLAEAVAEANRSYGFDLLGFTEEIQFTTYGDRGSFYDWHQDGLTGELAIRKLSIVVQLSRPGDYEGADLQLFDVEENWSPEEARDWRRRARRRGTAVVFPAWEYHRVTRIESGLRHSLVCWVGGPPFR